MTTLTPTCYPRKKIVTYDVSETLVSSGEKKNIPMLYVTETYAVMSFWHLIWLNLWRYCDLGVILEKKNLIWLNLWRNWDLGVILENKIYHFFSRRTSMLYVTDTYTDMSFWHLIWLNVWRNWDLGVILEKKNTIFFSYNINVYVTETYTEMSFWHLIWLNVWRNWDLGVIL